MPQFRLGDRVCIDLSHTTDPHFDQCHGRHGRVIQLVVDPATGFGETAQEAPLYRVKFPDGSVHNFRERQLRHPVEE